MTIRHELTSTGSTEEQKWGGFFSFSSVLLIVTAIVWFVVSWTARVLYASGYPTDPVSYLELISHHQALASVTWSLWIVADFLLLAPTVALYVVLRRYNRTLALLGSLFAMFFNIYDVCVTELGSLTLVNLSHMYGGTASETLRNTVVQAAAYGYYALPIQTTLSFAIGSIGYLLWCIPMLKGTFRRRTAVFGAIASAVGIAGSAAPLVPSSPILLLCQVICVPAIALWFVFVGFQLYRHGRAVRAASVRGAAAAA